MTRKSKRMQKITTHIEGKEIGSLEEAIELLKSCPDVKFDQTVDISLKLGIDPRKSDQQVRGIVSLTHGSGKRVSVLVVAKGDKVKEALDAGADYAGGEELLEKIKGGWTDFNTILTTPDMMREVSKLGKILGPKGLMPTPKAGTITTEVAQAVKDIKGGRIEFRSDKNGVINCIVGKLSFSTKKLSENINILLDAISRSRPPGAKGIFMKTLYLSSTMGPSLLVKI